MPRIRIAFWLILLLVFGLVPAQSQDNLLTNPSFEQGGGFGSYQGFGRPDFNFASGWGGWWTNTPRTQGWMNIEPIAFPHSGQRKRTGAFSQNIGRDGGTYTAAAYQTVGNIAQGTTLRASVFYYYENDPGTGAQVRIGIGSNAGNNPFGNIVWSEWSRVMNTWTEISIQRTVAAGDVTIFIYATQSTPNGPTGPNQLYLDDASLTVVGTGGTVDQAPADPNAPATVVAPPTTPPQIFAPFVQAQNNVEGGDVVHTVASGDTLAAIAVAYGVTVQQIRELNSLEGSFLSVGQRLIIRRATPSATPPPANTGTGTSGTGTSGTGTSGTGTSGTGTSGTGTSGTGTSGTGTSGTGTSGTGTSGTSPTSVAQVASPTPQGGAIVAVASPTTPPTSTPTTEPTPEPPTSTPTPDVSPTPTEIPPTPTDAPPAPVVEGEDADPVSTVAAVCVTMFEDADQNRLQLPGEGALAGGTIILRNSENIETGRHETTADGGPFCFEDLSPGRYTASATAPEGYGITTPTTLVVSVQAGVRFNISFGAAEGVAVALAPTPDSDIAPDTEEAEEAQPASDGISALLGLIVLGLAGAVLVGGAVVGLIVRRM